MHYLLRVDVLQTFCQLEHDVVVEGQLYLPFVFLWFLKEIFEGCLTSFQNKEPAKPLLLLLIGKTPNKVGNLLKVVVASDGVELDDIGVI